MNEIVKKFKPDILAGGEGLPPEVAKALADLLKAEGLTTPPQSMVKGSFQDVPDTAVSADGGKAEVGSKNPLAAKTNEPEGGHRR
ncbi:MAG: hypothetical protein AAF195_01810 [Pseudomonadota bacterium]